MPKVKTAPKSTVAEIVRLHGEVVDSLRLSLDKAIRIGELLAAQKKELKHGEFGPWIADNLPFTNRTAQNYIRLFRYRDKLKSENVSSLARAYRLIGRKERPRRSTPPTKKPTKPADDPAPVVPVGPYELTRAEAGEWGSLLRFLLEKVFHTADDKATILQALRFAKENADA
ncbi:MAG: DUF3102 domain-containing protein [Dehalococcoidia bacterium]